MKKMLEVQEYDAITCNADYKDDDSYKYIHPDIFSQLEDFILDYNKGLESDAMDFLRIGSRRNVGKIIQAKNYVGLIQMKNGYQLQVLPKIAFKDNDVDMTMTKRVFLKMLRSMKDFPSKVFNDANLKMDRMNLYEIYIHMYLQETREVVRRGIRSAYISMEDNQKYYKGKLLVNNHIKQNLTHKERFYVSYHELSVNRSENKLIKSTLLKLQKLTSSAKNMKEIGQLLTSFETVEPSKNYVKDFMKVVIDRNTKDYKVLMRWSKVFLMNQSFTTFSGSTSARALLFPMERVFEAYVARNLKKALADSGWEVSLQDKGYYLFDLPRQFALRPDIVITREDGSQIILDTKWKSLINNPRKNYGISQSDMYQMYAYSKKYNTPEVWLLYPTNEEVQDASDIQFKSNDNVEVRLFFIDVSKIEESLGEFVKQLQG